MSLRAVSNALFALSVGTLLATGAYAWNASSRAGAIRSAQHVSDANVAVRTLLGATWPHEALDGERPPDRAGAEARIAVRFAATRRVQAWTVAQSVDEPLAVADGPGGRWLVDRRKGPARAAHWSEVTSFLGPRARGEFVMDGRGEALEVHIPGPSGQLRFVPTEEAEERLLPALVRGARGTALGLLFGVLAGIGWLISWRRRAT